MANRQRICGPFACNRFDPEPANASPIPRGQMSRNSISGRKNKYASVISLQTRSLCSISFFQKFLLDNDDSMDGGDDAMAFVER